MDKLINYDSVPTPHGRYLLSPADLNLFRQLDDIGTFSLITWEQWWRDHYDILLSHGYQLRPRFHPNWTPSWHGTNMNMNPVACEDGYTHLTAKVIDAKRLSDGKVVAIKQVSSSSMESSIARMLSTPERLNDSRNHCVPIYDYFVCEKDDNIAFLVMTLLRNFDDPPFSYVDEIIDFVRQTLEGLVYIHSQGVAHRDLSDANIMMDGENLFGEDGFHLSAQKQTARDIAIEVSPYTRNDAGPVKYLFTDFGLSTYFADDTQPRLVTGNIAADRDVPEISRLIPYDPFAVDVFTLGMVYKRNFLDKYTNLRFLRPLCYEMTQMHPSERPTAAQSLSSFEQSLSRCYGYELRWRLHTGDERPVEKIKINFHSTAKELYRMAGPPLSSLFSFIRIILLSPFKFTGVLFFYGPKDLFGYVRRLLRNSSGGPRVE